MSDLNGSLDGIIENLRRLHWETETRLSEAQALYEQVKAERDHVVRMLKAAGAWEEEPKPKAKKPEPKPVRVNDETRRMVLDGMLNHIGEAIPGIRSFTVKSLAEGMGLHESSVRSAIIMLREEGVVRAIGKVPNSKRIAPEAYALVQELGPDE